MLAKFLAAVLVASTSTLGGTTMGDHDDLVPVITISPMPPSQGGRMTVFYTGRPGTVLQLDWHPSGTPATVTIDATGNASLTVPASATSVIVTDPQGGASPVSTTIS